MNFSLDTQTIYIAVTILGGLITIQTTFIKWLVDRFDKLSHAIINQSHITGDWLRDHEEKDQIRHEDNLKRFETIAITLARLDHRNEHTLHN